jgi:hypothetical protein
MLGPLKEVPDAARVLGLQIQVLNASTSGEIDAAFATHRRSPAALVGRASARYVSGFLGFEIDKNASLAIVAALPWPTSTDGFLARGFR